MSYTWSAHHISLFFSIKIWKCFKRHLSVSANSADLIILLEFRKKEFPHPWNVNNTIFPCSGDYTGRRSDHRSIPGSAWSTVAFYHRLHLPWHLAAVRECFNQSILCPVHLPLVRHHFELENAEFAVSVLVVVQSHCCDRVELVGQCARSGPLPMAKSRSARSSWLSQCQLCSSFIGEQNKI